MDASTNNPLSYATLKLKHKTQGTYCNEYGQYSLVAEPSDTLQVSYVGYGSNEFLITEGDTLRLNPVEKILKEVVVQPGKQKKLRCGLTTKKSDIWLGAQIAAEYAVKIDLPDTGKQYFINKIYFRARGNPAQGQSLQLHVYEGTHQGPGRELLPQIILIGDLDVTRKGIDVSAFNIVCQGSVFVGIEWIGNAEKGKTFSAYLASVFSKEPKTYSRNIFSKEDRWRIVESRILGLPDSGESKPLQLVASIEVE